jgi:hypothetical protein
LEVAIRVRIKGIFILGVSRRQSLRVDGYTFLNVVRGRDGMDGALVHLVRVSHSVGLKMRSAEQESTLSLEKGSHGI